MSEKVLCYFTSYLCENCFAESQTGHKSQIPCCPICVVSINQIIQNHLSSRMPVSMKYIKDALVSEDDLDTSFSNNQKSMKTNRFHFLVFD